MLRKYSCKLSDQLLYKIFQQFSNLWMHVALVARALNPASLSKATNHVRKKTFYEMIDMHYGWAAEASAQFMQMDSPPALAASLSSYFTPSAYSHQAGGKKIPTLPQRWRIWYLTVSTENAHVDPFASIK